MFFLQGVNSGIVICKKGISTIGRITADIVIKDSSVSRKHAEIEERNGIPFLRDCNSKYFTKHNGRLLLKSEEVKLESGDHITFGEVKFRFHIGEKLVVCSTGAKEREQTIATIVNKLGGELLKEWDNSCTHLTSSEILITLKVLHAIMDNKKIVVPHYWEVYLQNITTGLLPPDAADYYPPLGENIINSSYVKYNPHRNTVFEGKTFAFWNRKKQLKIESIIKKAGGKCIILGETSGNELLQLMSKCIVIDPENSIIEQKYSVVLEKYKESGKRLIPVQEIVLAILQCSCKENCNPRFNRAQTVFVKESQKHGALIPIVAETQSQQFDIDLKVKPNVIPASLEPAICVPTLRNNNRNLEVSVTNTVNETQLMAEETQLPAKRIKLDPEIEIISSVESPVQKKADLSKRNTDSIFKRMMKECSPPPAKRLKNDINMNPFTMIASTSKENPYNSIAKEEIIDLDLTNNPFGQCNIFRSNEVKSEDIEDTQEKALEGRTSNLSKNHKVSNKTVDFSNPRIPVKTKVKSGKKLKSYAEGVKINYSDMKHDVSNGKWMNSTVDLNDHSKIISQDEEERKWCEKFNNSVVIVVKDLLRKDRIDGEPQISQACSIGSQVKNFKKFRKVPVPKSGLMIKCSGFVFGASNLGVDYGRSDDEDNRDV
ncbi:hypothetical protein WA026_013523 [Henosepilachna vigintioctopunctata]|uniref:FHA domain-containing protein n=1 Tax=Henosepilachna vigintioctopunctata TaxID=420089 RepID=A0AAW1VCJ4_9CUCU